MNEFTVGYRQKYTKKFYHKTTGGFPSHNFHPLLPTGKRTPNPPENLRRRSTAPSAPRERYRRGKLVHTARSGRRRHEVRPTAIARHRKSSAAYPVRLYRQRPERPDCYCMPRKSHDIARNGYSYHTNGSHGEEILSPARNARPPPETTPAPPANRTPGTTPAATATRHRPAVTNPPTVATGPDLRTPNRQHGPLLKTAGLLRIGKIGSEYAIATPPPAKTGQHADRRKPLIGQLNDSLQACPAPSEKSCFGIEHPSPEAADPPEHAPAILLGSRPRSETANTPTGKIPCAELPVHACR